MIVIEYCFEKHSSFRVQWQWVCIIRMFVEQVVLKNEEALIFFARRLEKVI